MRKRILQTAILAVGLSAILVVGCVQTVIAHSQEKKSEAVVIDPAARERAALAWQELDESTPELHMGCGSAVEDVIAMGAKIKSTLPEVVEVVEEMVVAQEAGNWYKAEKRPLVCVDAGHLGPTSEGYKNTGAQSILGEIEHTWSYEVACVLREELLGRGYDVYMVRDTDDWDEFPYDLGERTIFVNEMKCDIMVSIHWDSFADKSVDGYHTIYRGSKDSQNYRLAKAVSDAYGEALNGAIARYARPTSRDDLWQLNWAGMPATIVECGFSSHYSDAVWLENEKNYEVIADGIANGIDDYFEGERKLRAEAEKNQQ